MPWFVVDPVALYFNSNNTVIYLNRSKQYRDFTKQADDFKHLEKASLEEFCALPQATDTYYKATYQAGRRPLLFHHVPHVLHKGPLSTEGMTVIRA